MKILPMNLSQMDKNQSIQEKNNNKYQKRLIQSFGTSLAPASRRKILNWLKFSEPAFAEKHGGKELKTKLKKLRNDLHKGDVISIRQEVKEYSRLKMTSSTTECDNISSTTGIGFNFIPCYLRKYVPVLTVRQGRKKFMIDLPVLGRGKRISDIANSKSFARFLESLTPENIEKYRQLAIKASEKTKNATKRK